MTCQMFFAGTCQMCFRRRSLHGSGSGRAAWRGAEQDTLAGTDDRTRRTLDHRFGGWSGAIVLFFLNFGDFIK